MQAKHRKYIIYALIVLAYLGYIQLLVIAERGAEGGNIESYADALWYSFITLTTVGYGDYFPVTTAGKLLSSVIVIASLGLLTFLLSRVSLKVYTYMEEKKQGKYGTRFENHFVIIGWDSFARQVAKQIVASGHKVAVITDQKNDLDIIREDLPADQTFTLFADFQNYDAMAKANIDKSAKVFVNFEDDSQALIHILNLRKIYADIQFVIILNSSDLKDTFRSVGVDYIVSKNEIAANLVASYLFEPDAASLAEDFMENSEEEDDQDISQYEVIDGNPYVNRPYLEAFLDLKKKYNAILLGITKSRQGNKLLKNPSEECTVETGDFLVLITSNAAKKQLQKTFKTMEGRTK